MNPIPPGGQDPSRIGPVAPPASSPGVEGAAPTDASGAATAVGNPLAAIAEALQTGRLTPIEARGKLVETIVRAQLSKDADPALVEEVRAEVEELLGDDPTLAGLLEPR